MPAKNVLPNKYVPVLPSGSTVLILNRLPRATLLQLVSRWPRMVNTQPQVTDDKTQRQLNKQVMAEVVKLKEEKSNKRIIIDFIMNYWPKGLNLLQLSQIDCQLVVDKPKSYSWQTLRVKDSMSKDVSMVLNPSKFLDTLSKDLSVLFMNHIYVCRHPKLQLIIIRIQLFDLELLGVSKPHISSNRPVFLAIPNSSPYIMYTPSYDLVTNVILQAIERCLPHDATNLLLLEKNTHDKPMKNLESLYILHGISKFSNSLGPWIQYADASFDNSPLTSMDEHRSFKRPLHLDDGEDSLKKLANLRFKGSLDGHVKHNPAQITLSHTEQPQEEFTSIVPIQSVEFTIKEELASVTIGLSGTDVFAGLHQLAVRTADEDKMIVNPKTMPSWLTGEEGRRSGTITNGIFKARE